MTTTTATYLPATSPDFVADGLPTMYDRHADGTWCHGAGCTMGRAYCADTVPTVVVGWHVDTDEPCAVGHYGCDEWRTARRAATAASITVAVAAGAGKFSPAVRRMAADVATEQRGPIRAAAVDRDADTLAALLMVSEARSTATDAAWADITRDARRKARMAAKARTVATMDAPRVTFEPDTVADTAEAVADRYPTCRAADVIHVHVASRAGESREDRMERVYAAGRAALAVATEDGGYSAWNGTEHYAAGILTQCIHLLDGHRIVLTWLD